MMLKNIIIAVIGLGGGLLVSAGVFSLISATGVVTKFAAKTHTGKHVRVYEDSLMLGGVLFNLWWVLEFKFILPGVLSVILEIIVGIIQGIFVGCLAVSISEALDATATFARRIKLRLGIGIIVASAAVGKIIAGLIQFSNNWSK